MISDRPKATYDFRKDKLLVKIYENRRRMGRAAAGDIVLCIDMLLRTKEEINIIFAAAPSQNDVLASLARRDLEWGRINAFHMDEYIGLSPDAPQGFGNFLTEHLFGLVGFKSVNLIDPSAKDPYAEAERYSKLLAEHPADIVVMGIGENGHIAFNDPPVADFYDTATVKPVPLDPVCRMQQVNDGCFSDISEVPTHALTLTVPALVSAPYLFCVVPAKTKAAAVLDTLTSDIGEHCPATILRTRRLAKMYLDPDSAALLPESITGKHK